MFCNLPPSPVYILTSYLFCSPCPPLHSTVGLLSARQSALLSALQSALLSVFHLHHNKFFSAPTVHISALRPFSSSQLQLCSSLASGVCLYSSLQPTLFSTLLSLLLSPFLSLLYLPSSAILPHFLSLTSQACYIRQPRFNFFNLTFAIPARTLCILSSIKYLFVPAAYCFINIS
jgi:hypothetical protein